MISHRRLAEGARVVSPDDGPSALVGDHGITFVDCPSDCDTFYKPVSHSNVDGKEKPPSACRIQARSPREIVSHTEELRPVHVVQQQSKNVRGRKELELTVAQNQSHGDGWRQTVHFYPARAKDFEGRKMKQF